MTCVELTGKVAFDRETAPYCHVLVRGDLPPAYQAVQATHAGMLAAARFPGADQARLAVLAVPDQAALIQWASRLERASVAFATFEEPDHHLGFTALCTAPGTARERRLLARLPLWNPGACACGKSPPA